MNTKLSDFAEGELCVSGSFKINFSWVEKAHAMEWESVHLNSFPVGLASSHPQLWLQQRLKTCKYSLFSQSLPEGVSWHAALLSRGLAVSASHTGLSRTDPSSSAAWFPTSLLARTWVSPWMKTVTGKLLALMRLAFLTNKINYVSYRVNKRG